jgi:predicted RNase H-like HicB family nuclease
MLGGMQEDMTRTYTAYIEYDPDTGLYVGTIPGLAGAHSQGKTLDELHENLREAVQLVLDERKARGEPLEVEPFVGIQQVVVRA